MFLAGISSEYKGDSGLKIAGMTLSSLEGNYDKPKSLLYSVFFANAFVTSTVVLIYVFIPKR